MIDFYIIGALVMMGALVMTINRLKKTDPDFVKIPRHVYMAYFVAVLFWPLFLIHAIYSNLKGEKND